MLNSTVRDSTSTTAAADEFTKVVQGDYCIGCGACAAVTDGIDMRLSDAGLYQPAIEPGTADLAAAAAVCPFTTVGPNEDELGDALFASAAGHHPGLGRYISTFAGHVAEGEFRARGSSGGMGSWLVTEALRTGLVDRVIHVKATNPDETGGVLFAFGVSTTPEQAAASSKSRYYPVELSKVIEVIRSEPGRYAVVGIPCFLKAVRRLRLVDPVIEERVTLTVGLICGHMKTTGFAESLAWQMGIPPEEIEAVDFRRKFDTGVATAYGFMARRKGSTDEVVAPMASLLGRDWGMGFFKPNACEFCDDVTGELADVSVGDAWLPEFLKDSNGTNVVIIRSPAVAAMVDAGRVGGRLALTEITADRAAASQSAGLRHRREGLAFRLWLTDRLGMWRPVKRVAPALALTTRQKIIMLLRLKLRRDSIVVFAKAKSIHSIRYFTNKMKPAVLLYKTLYLSRKDAMYQLRKRLPGVLGR